MLLQLLFVHPLQDNSLSICTHGSHSFGVPAQAAAPGGAGGGGVGRKGRARGDRAAQGAGLLRLLNGVGLVPTRSTVKTVACQIGKITGDRLCKLQ